MKTRTFYFLSFAVLFYVRTAYGADSTATSSKISWSGLVDIYYSKNFNNPSSQMNQLRNFDIYESQFGLNLAKLTVQEQAQPVGFRLDTRIRNRQRHSPGFAQSVDGHDNRLSQHT